MPLLELRNVSKHFGGVSAIRGVNLTVQPGQIAGLIGPNGAGKTTLFNCITGITRIDDGEILFDEGEPLRGLPSERILSRGIARTFQNLRIFRNMTVLENVAVGFHARTRSGFWGALFGTRRARREQRLVFEKSLALLTFVGLEACVNEIAANLPYGRQKRLEIARSLASGPKLLLLDEPVAGMNPTEKEEIAALIRRIRAQGVAVLLIEHDMKMVMPLCDRIVVMDEGAKIAEGLPSDIRCNPRVIEAYLGEA